MYVTWHDRKFIFFCKIFFNLDSQIFLRDCQVYVINNAMRVETLFLVMFLSLFWGRASVRHMRNQVGQDEQKLIDYRRLLAGLKTSATASNYNNMWGFSSSHGVDELGYCPFCFRFVIISFLSVSWSILNYRPVMIRLPR